MKEISEWVIFDESNVLYMKTKYKLWIIAKEEQNVLCKLKKKSYKKHTLFLMESSQHKFCVVFLNHGRNVSFECSDAAMFINEKMQLK